MRRVTSSGDVQHVLRFQSEIEFLQNRFGKQFDQGRRIGQSRNRNATHQLRSHPGHGGNIRTNKAIDIGSLHLDHHIFTGFQPGCVNLGNGCRRQALRVEEFKNRIEWTPDLLLHGPPNVLKGIRRNLVQAVLEFVHQFFRKESSTRGNDLGQLDIRRPQPLEGPSQSERKALA
jgi:hypothetical protein